MAVSRVRLGRFSASLPINHLPGLRSGRYISGPMSQGSLPRSNKTGAGNALGLRVVDPVAVRRVSIAAGSGGAGDFSGGGGPIGSAWSWAGWIGARRGNLRVSDLSRAEVRTGKSERGAQIFDLGRFSGPAVQPDRLKSAAAACGRGVRPPRPRRASPPPVVPGGHRNGEKPVRSARSGGNAACQAVRGRPEGREVLSTPVGSGVRAAPGAGVNGRFRCRPISPENGGSGEECARSCANGVNGLTTLESVAGRVN